MCFPPEHDKNGGALGRRVTASCSALALAFVGVALAGPAVAADGNGLSLVSHSISGAPADSESAGAQVSGNGRFVCFHSTASDIVARDAVGTSDVFRYDSSTGKTILVSRNASGRPAGGSTACRISANGRYVEYETTSPDVAAGLPGNDPRIVVFDVTTKSASIVSRTPDGTPTTVRTHGVDLSGDGRYVVYADQSPSAGGGVHDYDIFRYDRTTGTTVSLVHEGETGRTMLTSPAVSKDGRYVAYLRTPPKGSQVVASASLYRLDTLTGTSTLVSATPSGTNGAANPDLSDNGRFLAFSTNVAGQAPGDTTAIDDILLFDATTAATALVSRTPSGQAGNDRSTVPSISGNGRYIAFQSNASDLVAGDDNNNPDIYRYDRQTKTTSLINTALDGGFSVDYSLTPSIGGTGDKIVFKSPAVDLVAGDASFHQDVFLWALL